MIDQILGVKTMNYTIEKLPLQPILYMRRVGAYGIENFELMTALKEWANSKDLFIDSIIYGIAHDDESIPPEECRYDVCLVTALDILADPAVKRGEIPAGNYAVFTSDHTAEAVQKFWASIIPRLQEENLQWDRQKPILERYKYRVIEDGKCDFCVPIL